LAYYGKTKQSQTMKKFIILSILAALSLSSCKKNLTENQDLPKGNTTTKFSELKTTESFDWKTNKELTFNYVGFPTINPVKTTLTISSEDGKVVLYSGMQEMSANLEVKLAIPTNMGTIKVKYGAVEKTYQTNVSKISFDILPVLEIEQ
jgi:hypothetical protein